MKKSIDTDLTIFFICPVTPFSLYSLFSLLEKSISHFSGAFNEKSKKMHFSEVLTYKSKT